MSIALRRQVWQLDYYSEGSIPDALIGVPAGWTPDQIKQFQDYWDTEFAGDLARRRKAKFVPGDTAVKIQQTKETEQKNDFDEWLAASSATRFAHDPEKGTPVFRKDHAPLRLTSVDRFESKRSRSLAAAMGGEGDEPRHRRQQITESARAGEKHPCSHLRVLASSGCAITISAGTKVIGKLHPAHPSVVGRRSSRIRPTGQAADRGDGRL